MKKLFFIVLGVLPAHSAVLMSENFESYDVGLDNLEAQNQDWLTDPIGTSSIAVLANDAGSPATFGGKSLVVGGFPTDNSELELGVAYALAPTTSGFNPADHGLETEMSFSVDLILNSGTGQSSLTDDFRVSFFDLSGNPLAALLFTNNLDGNGAVDPGFATIIRSNMTDAGVFDTQVLIPLNTAFTLNLVLSPLFNKWSGSISQGGVDFPLFVNVDMTQNQGPPVPEANVGAFALDWLKGSGQPQWGVNHLVADNFLLQSQTPVPEPSVPLLVSAFAMTAFLRRRR